MSQCKFILLPFKVDAEFHEAQQTFNLHLSLEDVALDAVQHHHDNLMSMYTFLKEIRRGAQAQPEAQPSQAASADDHGHTDHEARAQDRAQP